MKLAELNGKMVGVIGVARSGLAAIGALRAAGATVLAYDDRPQNLEKALALGAGRLAPSDLPGMAALVVSPGIPLTHPAPHPLVAAAMAAGVPLTCDIALFVAGRGDRPTVGITGTNGKSTTTALTHHLLVSAGRHALRGGNIGEAVLGLPQGPADEIAVLELSSFQLDLCTDLPLQVAAWINLTPDHLDRHGDIAGYVAAKKRIFAGLGDDDVAVVGVDDEISAGLAKELARTGRQVIAVSALGLPADGVGVVDGQLVDAIDGESNAVADLASLGNLRGVHNQQNIAIAYAICRSLGLGRAEAVAGLSSFQGLPHRMELVGRDGDILFVNDSKATNTDAALRSLRSYRQIYWIAGGRAAPGGFKSLAGELGAVREAFLIGEAAEEIAQDLQGLVPMRRCGTLDAALDAARAAAAAEAGPEPVILLAPACKSFDQFSSYEDRGDRFRTLVAARLKEHPAQ